MPQTIVSSARLAKNWLFETLCLALVASLAAVTAAQAQAPRSPTPDSLKGAVGVETIADGLEHPWGLAFLPDKRMLVTERPGRLRLVSPEGKLSEPLAGVPQVYARGQGGLLDVALSPTFDKDRLVYLSFAEAGEGGAGTAVARGRLGERGLENTQVIWRQQPKVSGPNHFGSRIVFRRDGTLFVTLGDRFNYSDSAQDLSTTLGKIVRINSDGSAPKDNPFVGRAGARPEIWSQERFIASYGKRGGSIEVHTFDGLPEHRMVPSPDQPETMRVIDTITKFISRQTG